MTKRAIGEWACRHCKQRKRGRLKPLLERLQKRRMPLDALERLVVEVIREQCAGKDLEQDFHYVTKEGIALQLHVREHEVAQVLHRLNLSGVVSQPVHRAPHDSTRDPWTAGRDSSWQADKYRVVKAP